MKKSLKKALGTILACLLTLTAFSSCRTKEQPKTLLPDYASSGKEFEFFAYRPLSDGRYWVNGVEHNAGELRTEENYKIYKNAGFTMSFVSSYLGENWETSDTKKEMDMLSAAGVNKVIIPDIRLTMIANLNAEEILNSDVARWASQEALERYVKECLQDYIKEPAFYGLSIGDEPAYTKAESYGILYKAIKKAAAELGKEDIYIHVNFLPIDGGACSDGKFAPLGSFENFEEAYV